MAKRCIMAMIACLAVSLTFGQNDFDDFFNKSRQQYDDFSKASKQRYESFHDSVNALYAQALKDAWVRLDAIKPEPKPKDDEIPPIVTPAPVQPVPDPKPEPSPRPVVINDIIAPPQPSPQPMPVEPIVAPVEPTYARVVTEYMGIVDTVRVPSSGIPRLKSADRASMSNFWSQMAGNKAFNATIADCIALREKYALCDWAYMALVRQAAEKAVSDYSAAQMLAAYIFSQSGYKMRLARQNSKIEMLFATDFIIIGKNYVRLDGEKYYYANSANGTFEVCNFAFPAEKAVSLQITRPQLFPYTECAPRSIASGRNKDLRMQFCVNPNLINFYNTYPVSRLENDFMTRWAICANAPIDQNLKEELYTPLKEALDKEPTQYARLKQLLHWLQTGLAYGYDNEIWGHDRAFFAEETLYYPKCDCEDHAILFSRLVRDLLGLDVALVYYPGHLATAVCIERPDGLGDYLDIQGRKYLVCDPTIKGYGADPGVTMTGMNNSEAKAILLQ